MFSLLSLCRLVNEVKEITSPPPQFFNLKNHIEKENETLPPISTSPVPAIPANSFQLESDFRKLKGCPDKMYLYLKVREEFFECNGT